MKMSLENELSILKKVKNLLTSAYNECGDFERLEKLETMIDDADELKKELEKELEQVKKKDRSSQKNPKDPIQDCGHRDTFLVYNIQTIEDSDEGSSLVNLCDSCYQTIMEDEKTDLYAHPEISEGQPVPPEIKELDYKASVVTTKTRKEILKVLERNQEE